MREFAAGEDDGDGDNGAVELGFVHVRDGGFGGGGGRVEDVGCAAVGHDWRRERVSLVGWGGDGELVGGGGRRTLSVHGKVDVFDWAVCTEYLA